MFLSLQSSLKPVFLVEAKATDPVLGGGSLRVRTEGPTTASADTTAPPPPHTTQRARAAGETATVYMSAHFS